MDIRSKDKEDIDELFDDQGFFNKSHRCQIKNIEILKKKKRGKMIKGYNKSTARIRACLSKAEFTPFANLHCLETMGKGIDFAKFFIELEASLIK